MRLPRLLMLAFALAGGCQLIVDPDKDDVGTPDGGDGAADGASDGSSGDGQDADGASDGDADGADGHEDGSDAGGCASLTCEVGTVCVEDDQGARCVPDEENPCNLVDCQPNTVCEVQNGQAVCVPLATGCETISCNEGQHCEERDPCAAGAATKPVIIPPECQPEPVCVDDPSCANTACDDDEYCDDASGVPVCHEVPSCEDFACRDGQVCALRDVDCVTEPCFPQPSCVDDPCDPNFCWRGTHCEVVPGLCGDTSCDPIGTCVRDP